MLAVFETSIGWFGIQYSGDVICRVKFGFTDRADAITEMLTCHGIEVADKLPRWHTRFQAYADGARVTFSELAIDCSGMSAFQKRVTDACREIPYGSVVTYGRLAEIAGSPGAARATGTTMRTNRFPIVVPCHRVVAANGLGGYSASGGVTTKTRLLTMERNTQLENHARQCEIGVSDSLD